MEVGIGIRCGSCRGGGWLNGWFKRCVHCRGRGWFDPVTAPGGLGPLVAASEAVRTGACRALLVRPALPWERFPVPDEVKAREGAPDETKWDRAVRASAVILYEHADTKVQLAGGLELSRLSETHALIRELFWQTLPDGGVWRCVDGQLRDVYLRFSFFRAWKSDWLEVVRWDGDTAPARPRLPGPPTPQEITGDAQKYVTGKLFVGPPKEDE
jgi:hypothetical protein